MKETNNLVRKEPTVNALQHVQEAIRTTETQVALQHESRSDNLPQMPTVKAQAHEKGA